MLRLTMNFATTAAKRLRLTGSGAIKRKGEGMRHNTGLQRPRVTQRRRGRVRLVANPTILKRMRLLIKGVR